MPPTPIHSIRLRAVVLAPTSQTNPFLISDGKPFGGPQVAALVAAANVFYQQAGITFTFDPAHDLEGLRDDVLNLANDQDNSAAAQKALAAREARAALHQGQVVVYFREGSGGYANPPDHYAVALKKNDPLHLAHELGHYLGLAHVHTENLNLNVPAGGAVPGKTYAENIIRKALLPEIIEMGIKDDPLPAHLLQKGNAVLRKAMDGDTPDKNIAHPVTDTPPGIHEWPGTDAGRCTGEVAVTVRFVDLPNLRPRFTFTPERSNIMSYFGGCPQTTKFSNQQIAVMRSMIETGVRRHLLGPALNWTGMFEVQGNGSTTHGPAAAAFDNRIYVFVKGTDNRIYGNSALPQQPFGDRWFEVQGNGSTTHGPAAAAFDNRIYVFVKGTDNRIYGNSALPQQPFGDRWFEVQGNGSTTHGPAAAAFDNRIYVFVKGTDNRIYGNSALPQQPFGDRWFEVQGNGSTTHGPAAAAFDNRIYVFVKGTDNRIYGNSALPQQPFGDRWFEVQGNGKTNEAPAAAAYRGRLYVFVKGKDNRIYVNSALPQQPFGDRWFEVPGAGFTDAAPTATVFDGRLYLVVRGPNGQIFGNSASHP